jgi:hypothetical protein
MGGGSQPQVYEGGSAGQGPRPPPSPEMSEVGMIIGTLVQRGCHDMEMKVVMQRTGSSLSCI